MVGDLLPEKHQALIDKLLEEADEDDENPTMEAYFGRVDGDLPRIRRGARAASLQGAEQW